MIDYAAVLKENPNGVLATQDGSKGKTRVFQYLFTDGNKVYFCTSNKKNRSTNRLRPTPMFLSAPTQLTLRRWYQ